jgi:hypothetical protein
MMESVLSPLEIKQLVEKIRESDCLKSLSAINKTMQEKRFENFLERWQEVYTLFQQNPVGELSYRDLILYFKEEVLANIRKYLSAKGKDRQAAIAIEFMLYPQGASLLQKKRLFHRRKSQKTPLLESFQYPEFDRPLFIVSAPRAGSSLLFENLSKFEEIWSIGKESHDIETEISYLHPKEHGYKSNRLTEDSLEVATDVKQWFAKRLQNRDKRSYFQMERPSHSIRFLEKTPKNALRIPFLKKIFPQARFIFLYRDPLENISSLLEFWRSNRFPAYRDMPNWSHREWYGLLPPNWERLKDSSLAEITTYQWRIANQIILDDLSDLSKKEYCFVTYKDLIEQPRKTFQRLSSFAQLAWNDEIDQLFSQPLPLSSMVISPPITDKWRQHEAEISPYLLTLTGLIEQLKNANMV